jgi:D-lactate dehydrogenase
MKIAFFSAKSYDKEFFNRLNVSNEIIYWEVALNEKTVHLAKGADAICVFVNDVLNEPTFHQLSELGIRLITLRCAGFNNVDLNAAHKYNIPVVRVPAYSPNAVAEHAVALILTLNRHTHKAYNRIREGNFSIETFTGFDLAGKTVGVIGTGKIGQAFCRIMLGFGCSVLAFDVIANKQLEAIGVKYLPLIDVLEHADILSLHCPLTELSHHIINKETLGIMKKGAMLINTSRGALIDAKAAVAALKSGQLAYLGIDVYEQEETLFFNDLSGKVIQDDIIMRLISFPNVLVTAHQGFFTKEALTQIATTTFQNISDFENGRKLLNKL